MDETRIYATGFSNGAGFTYLLWAARPTVFAAFAPVAGRLLVWNNMAMDGSPNPWTQHEGQPVGDGTKYIVTKWFREGRFV